MITDVRVGVPEGLLNSELACCILDKKKLLHTGGR